MTIAIMKFSSLPILVCQPQLGAVSQNSLVFLDRNLTIPDSLNSAVVKSPFGHNLVTSDAWEDLCPKAPVDNSQQQNTDTNHREHVVRVPIGIPVTIRWDERYESEEDVGKQINYGDREVRVPG
jgi:hypothetical protein